MKSILLTIGDELLIGQVVNTNSAFLARQLNAIGVEVLRVVTVGDDRNAISRAVRDSVAEADVTIVTGGLGPTHDDITKEVLCEVFGTSLEVNAEAERNVREILAKRNFTWSAAADHQILFPRGAVLIPNHQGTASGMLFVRGGRYCIALPGVPFEMEPMITEWVIPYFAGKTKGKAVIHRTLKTTGISESKLAELIGPVEHFLHGGTLAFLPAPSGVRLRITAIGEDAAGAGTAIATIEAWIRARSAEFIYGADEEELADVIGRMMIDRKMTLAVAESCTGGLIADRITAVPGCSAWFERGVVTYSNTSKTDILGVPRELIDQHGAVSGEVAVALAMGIRSRAGTDFALSTTGIAGPSGGTPQKPVGTVWIGYADAEEHFALRYSLGTGRERVKERATQAALDLVRRKLSGLRPPHVDPSNIYRV